jgi:hypothetical protein
MHLRPTAGRGAAPGEQRRVRAGESLWRRITRVTGRSADPARLGAGADRFAKAFRALREQLNIWRVNVVGSKCWGGGVGGWRWVLRGGGFWQSQESVAPLGLMGGAWRFPGAYAAGLLAFAPLGLVGGWRVLVGYWRIPRGLDGRLSVEVSESSRRKPPSEPSWYSDETPGITENAVGWRDLFGMLGPGTVRLWRSPGLRWAPRQARRARKRPRSMLETRAAGSSCRAGSDALGGTPATN